MRSPARTYIYQNCSPIKTYSLLRALFGRKKTFAAANVFSLILSNASLLFATAVPLPALAAKIDGRDYKVFCLSSDGEHEEGSVWEAVMAAAHFNLNNLCVLIDRNNIQTDGTTESVIGLRDLKSKYSSFGWKVLEVDGHNHEMIFDALSYFKVHKLPEPVVIIAHTILGKGVSFMEDECSWHGKAPSKEEYLAALRCLDG